MARVGDYEILGPLGQGGAGMVHRARSPDGREVAIKRLLGGGLANSARRKRFDREIRALARFEHPNLIRLLDHGTVAGSPYVVMELVEAGSLDDLLGQQGPLGEGDALRLALGIARALEHAHARGVLHRDVKPANVLLRDGQPLLTDFGLTRDIDPASSLSFATREGHMLGTLGYAAPELLRGHLPDVGPQADVYGLGATLYALLTGRAPHVAETALELLAAALGDPEPPSVHRPGLSAALDALCMRCLRRDPDDRPSMPEVATDLQDLWDLWELPLTPRPSVPWGWVVALGIAALSVLAWASGGRSRPVPVSPPEPERDLAAEARASPSNAREPTAPPVDPGSERAESLYQRGLDLYRADRERDAEPLFLQAEQLGHADAAYRLAQTYRRRGEPERSRQHLELAVERGHLDATYNLGVLCSQGPGPLELDRAAACFRRCVEAGDVVAMSNLVGLLVEGGVAERFPGEAQQVLRRAAARGDVPATVSLGKLLLSGRWSEAEHGETQRVLEAGARAGHRDSLFMLATSRLTASDHQGAYEPLLAAAEAGLPEAALLLAELYLAETGVPPGMEPAARHAEAVTWLERAAQCDEPDLAAAARAKLAEALVAGPSAR